MLLILQGSWAARVPRNLRGAYGPARYRFGDFMPSENEFVGLGTLLAQHTARARVSCLTRCWSRTRVQGESSNSMLDEWVKVCRRIGICFNSKVVCVYGGMHTKGTGFRGSITFKEARSRCSH